MSSFFSTNGVQSSPNASPSPRRVAHTSQRFSSPSVRERRRDEHQRSLQRKRDQAALEKRGGMEQMADDYHRAKERLEALAFEAEAEKRLREMGEEVDADTLQMEEMLRLEQQELLELIDAYEHVIQEDTKR